jgi:uncharacterized protein with HEPN domain
MRDDRERLLDVLDAIEGIRKYAARGKNAFKEDELIQTWILHHLQILGEAASRISDDLREQYHEIPWHKIIGMRNILVHDYFAIDIDVVWSVIENDLPELERSIRRLIKTAG